MAFLQMKKNFPLSGAASMLTLAVIVSAACGGSNKSGDLGSSGNGSGSGDNGSNCTGFSCTNSGDDSGVFGDDASSGSIGPVSTNVVHTACPGPLSSSQATAIQKAGSGAGSLKWLYPYDGTVFPGGIGAPTLQWSQSAQPDGIFVHLHSNKYDYTGCFAGVNPGQLALNQTEWETAYAQSAGLSDPLTVQLSTITGGTVSGPITETWTFAKGSLKGTIYYNTYNSAIAGNNGAVMSLTAGASAPTALLNIAGVVPFGPCISCHSVSADGSMLAAQRHLYPGGLQAPGSMTFDLAKGLPNSTNPTPLASDVMDDWGFSAMYPDGSLLLTAGESASSTSITAAFPVANVNNPGMIGPVTAAMFNTSTGAKMTFSGLADAYAMMPMFSPDGTKLVYNDITNDGGHALVVQNFNKATSAFSSPTVVYKDSTNYPGWPFFTPDGNSVVFAMGPSSNFASIPPGSFSSVGPVQASASDVTTSNLYIVNLASPGKAQSLDLANGVKGGQSYLPFGARDENLNFYPTVLPVSAGGYFWVFFTSRRQYGNLMVDTTNGNAVPDPVFHAETKKIWAAAISIGGTGDPSHPPFVFPGQELASGNIRAFPVLSPCKGDGASCESGIDCCGGSCTSGKCGVPNTCAGDGDKCSATIPCCTSSDQCFGGYCGFIAK